MVSDRSFYSALFGTLAVVIGLAYYPLSTERKEETVKVMESYRNGQSISIAGQNQMGQPRFLPTNLTSSPTLADVKPGETVTATYSRTTTPLINVLEAAFGRIEDAGYKSLECRVSR